MEKDTVNKKRDFGQKLQDFMASYRGKVIMNYAYSWGAAIVIAGTLFKLTHLPGANLMLWIGMEQRCWCFLFLHLICRKGRRRRLHPAVSLWWEMAQSAVSVDGQMICRRHNPSLQISRYQ